MFAKQMCAQLRTGFRMEMHVGDGKVHAGGGGGGGGEEVEGKRSGFA